MHNINKLENQTVINEDVKEVKTNEFLLSIQYDQDVVTLHGFAGCSFSKLAFTIKDSYPIAIDQDGMQSLKEERRNIFDPNLSDFLFKIEKKNDWFKLYGLTGTNWKELEFKPINKTHFINEFGVSRYNPEKWRTISGNVTNKNGEPLERVNVVEFDPFDYRVIDGTRTGKTGRFSYTAKRENAIIKCSKKGYKKVRLDISGKEEINVILEKEEINPEEQNLKGKPSKPIDKQNPKIEKVKKKHG